ncbi:hypothetical protein QYE76_011034 [Lolium multiflorum]|uniref:Gag-pol polyprotein n=1 Tax=Lolium multiflorum TaxID=4521 RepID=A0AAD8X4X0_LOLMU|nr:hypothetical protein QYE76_011034 [Lolium multiflorum]
MVAEPAGASSAHRHWVPAMGKSSHTNRNCKWVNDLKTDPEAGYKRARKHRPRGKGGKGKNKEKDEDSSEAMDEDEASPDPKDCFAANKSNPFIKKSAECYALVVSPRIDGYDFPKCLMDGGASLNIIIKLLVAFGDVNNFREEMITFEVVPFKSSYNVIFGRPTYHKFHARACCIYNKLKIPGPNVMITVSGDCKEGEPPLQNLNPSKEIFSELDETFAQGPIFARSFQKTEEITKWGHEAAGDRAARPGPWPRGPTPWAPRVALTYPSAYLKPPSRNPRTESHDTENLPETPPPRIPSRGFGDRLRHPGRGDSSPGGLFIAMIASE